MLKSKITHCNATKWVAFKNTTNYQGNYVGISLFAFLPPQSSLGSTALPQGLAKTGHFSSTLMQSFQN